jgi:glycosyltransferase involved in cell wall biosynthesis
VKFSIVTPSFNQGRYIRDCIESVQIQTEVQTEHIVIDACSTDETVSVLKSYPHLQWVSEPDQGQTDGINKGLGLATGDWLMWLNADDYLLPEALKEVTAFAETHGDADVIYGDCDFVDEQKRVVGRKRERDFDLKMLLFYGCYIPSTATLFHRRVLEAGHQLDPHFRVCMDYDWYMRLARAGFHFSHVNETLACFRWHASNISTAFATRRRKERLQVQRQHLGATGRSWLGQRWLLLLLECAYKLKRRTRSLA